MIGTDAEMCLYLILLKSICLLPASSFIFLQSNKHDLFLVTGKKYCYDTYSVMMYLQDHNLINYGGKEGEKRCHFNIMCLLRIYALPQSISSVTGNNFHSTPPKEKKYMLVNFPMEKFKNIFFKFFIIRSIFNQDKS